METTKLENALLHWIGYNEMTQVNGARPETTDDTACWFWAGEFASEQGISTAAARGVASSLSKKGLAYFMEDEGETLCGLTEAGLGVLHTL